MDTNFVNREDIREREAKIREMELSNCEKDHQLKLVN